jgi:putative transposase
VERTCLWLVESINAARLKCSFSLWAFVFMPSHIHLLIRPRHETYSISQILKTIKEPVGRRAIRYLKENNPSGLVQLATNQQYREHGFWQKGGGYDRNITKSDTLIECVRYIHNNPVRKNLVRTPQEWAWSSAAQWVGIIETPLRIDKEDWPIFA